MVTMRKGCHLLNRQSSLLTITVILSVSLLELVSDEEEGDLNSANSDTAKTPAN